MATARIEEVVGEFVNLKRAGKDYRALSPFSNEKTPSFFVVPDKQIFKDFSSGKGGTVVTFLMEHEHFSYPEALRWLAHKYGIELQEEQVSEETREEDKTREILLRIYQFASEWFTRQMMQTDEGKSVGLGYFKSRDLKDSTIKDFNLGYCPQEGSQFTEAARKAGFTEEMLITSGLTKKKEGSRPYDAYRGRVVFPIHNLSGSPIAFGARVLQKDTKAPKYINSPETAVYHKSKVLYGLYQAKNEIVRQDICYLTEGYTDVISLHQSGIKNTVSSSGTALTREQIRLIKRYTPNITLIYDGDKAGIRASFRGIDLILEEGLNVRALLLPDGEDPDSFARQNDRKALDEYFKAHVTDFISFKTNILKDEVGDDPIKKAGLIKDIVASIALIPDVVQRTVYIRQCSLMLDITEEVLLSSLNLELRKKHREKERTRRFEQEASVPADDAIPSTLAPSLPSPLVDPRKDLELDLMRILVRYGDCFIRTRTGEEVQVAPFIFHELERDNLRFADGIMSRLMAETTTLLEKQEWETRYLTHHADLEVSKMAVDLLTERYRLDNWELFEVRVHPEEVKLERAVEEAVYSLKLFVIRKSIAQREEELKEVYNLDTEDEQKINELLVEISKLNAIKSSFSLAMGRIILG
jgi:DNA primase